MVLTTNEYRIDVIGTNGGRVQVHARLSRCCLCDSLVYFSPPLLEASDFSLTSARATDSTSPTPATSPLCRRTAQVSFSESRWNSLRSSRVGRKEPGRPSTSPQQLCAKPVGLEGVYEGLEILKSGRLMQGRESRFQAGLKMASFFYNHCITEHDGSGLFSMRTSMTNKEVSPKQNDCLLPS